MIFADLFKSDSSFNSILVKYPIPYLILVTRGTTERPEAVNEGTVILVGTKTKKIVEEAQKLLNDKEYYNSMSLLHNPYGDGEASQRIVDYINNL